MNEIILGLIVLGVLVFHAWYVREKNKEINKLVNALLSKTPQDMERLTIADNMQAKPQPVVPPDLIPENELSLEEWEEKIINGRN